MHLLASTMVLARYETDLPTTTASRIVSCAHTRNECPRTPPSLNRCPLDGAMRQSCSTLPSLSEEYHTCALAPMFALVAAASGTLI
jgi:hypothetical protein